MKLITKQVRDEWRKLYSPPDIRDLPSGLLWKFKELLDHADENERLRSKALEGLGAENDRLREAGDELFDKLDHGNEFQCSCLPYAKPNDGECANCEFNRKANEALANWQKAKESK